MAVRQFPRPVRLLLLTFLAFLLSLALALLQPGPDVGVPRLSRGLDDRLDAAMGHLGVVLVAPVRLWTFAARWNHGLRVAFADAVWVTAAGFGLLFRTRRRPARAGRRRTTRLPCLLLLFRHDCCLGRLASSGPLVVPIHVAEVAAGLDDVAHAALELLGLGKPAVHLAVPEHAGLQRRGRVGRRRRGAVLDGHDKGPARRRLQGHLAQGGGEGREEFLGELGAILVYVCGAKLGERVVMRRILDEWKVL